MFIQCICIGSRIPTARAGIGRHRKEATANRGRDQAAPESIDLTEPNFDAALVGSQGLVLVDFWAEWCGPCRAIAPLVEELAEALAGRVMLMKINVDENPGLAARYHVRSVPTICSSRTARSSTGSSVRSPRPCSRPS
jgi:thioredoxin